MENPEKASPKFPIVINLCAIIITCAILLIIVIIAVVIYTGGNHKPRKKLLINPITIHFCSQIVNS